MWASWLAAHLVGMKEVSWDGSKAAEWLAQVLEMALGLL